VFDNKNFLVYYVFNQSENQNWILGRSVQVFDNKNFFGVLCL